MVKTDQSKNWRRIESAIASFVLGSVAGAILFIYLKYLGFLLPAAIAAYAMLQARKEAKQFLVGPIH